MKPGESGTLILTGANGFIGSWVTLRFAEAGWRVYAGCREVDSAPRHANVQPFEWNTAKGCRFPKIPATATGPKVCLHLAYTTRHSGRDRTQTQANIHGTRAAQQEAKRVGCTQQVFLSSCSAHKNALSEYGRSKYKLEHDFRGPGDLVVRPALVIGPGGLYLRMQQALRSSPFVPLFDGGKQPVQVIQLAHLGEVLFQAITTGRTGRIVVAESGVQTMKQFMSGIAQSIGKTPRFIPIPTRLALPLVQTAEALGLKLPITSENLLGLMGMVAQRPTAGLLGEVNWDRGAPYPQG